MAISYITQLSYSGDGNGDALPVGYAIGDLILVFAWGNDSTTNPALAGQGFIDYDIGGTGNLRYRIGYKYAEASSGLNIGNWNGAEQVHVIVIRGGYIKDASVRVNASSGILTYPAVTPLLPGEAYWAWFVGTEFGDNDGATTSPTGFTQATGRNANGSRVASHFSNAAVTSLAAQNITKGGTNGAFRIVGVEIGQLRTATFAYSEGVDTLSATMKVDRILSGSLTDGDDTVVGLALASRLATFAYSEGVDTISGQGFVQRNVTFAYSEGVDTLSSASTIGRAITGALTDGNDTVAGTSTQSRLASFAYTEGLDFSTSASFVQRNITFAYTEVADAGTKTGQKDVGLTGALVDGDDTAAGTSTQSRNATFAYTEVADAGTKDGTIGRAITGALVDGNDTAAGTAELSRAVSFTYAEGLDTATATGYLQRNATFAYTEGLDTLSGVADLLVTANFAYTEGNDPLVSQSFLTITANFNYTEGADAGTKTGLLQRNVSFNYTERPDIVSDVYFDFVSQATFFYTEGADKLLAGYTPDEGQRPPDCIDVETLVEAGLDRLLTQYRESPHLIYFLRMAMEELWAARNTICDLPEYFDLDSAIGDQLTLIGERMGFGRCHCVCAPRRIFGFKCADDQGLGDVYVGFCEDGDWAACAGGGVIDICIDDDELYRKFLQVRAYQARQLFDMESLTAAIRILYGERARVLSADRGQVVVAPFRRLTDTERALIKLVPRILPVAPGIKIRFHMDPYPNIAGFGEGWGGFCDTIPGEAIFTDGDGNRYIETATGIEYLEEDEDTRNAYWMCPVDVKPYSC